MSDTKTLTSEDTVRAMEAQSWKLIPMSVEYFRHLYFEALEQARKERQP